MRQVILDTETTGLNADLGHRIIEVGCVELINRRLTGKHFHQYINPEREIEAGALAVHGITTEFLQDKPLFTDIAERLMDFIQGAELIIHNAPFDISFLNAEFKPYGKRVTDHCRVIDTLVLARQLHAGQRNSLDALCKRYSIDNTHREFHGALLDAHLLSRVYLAMTGGQATLFGDGETMEHAADWQQTSVSPNLQKPRLLPVMRANQEEVAEHAQRLHALKKAGKCLWLEEELATLS